MHNQSNGGSYALQVMNQLTHHILQDQVNKQQPTNMPTPRYPNVLFPCSIQYFM